MIERFSDAVGVEGEDVAGTEVAFADFTVPLFENAEDGGGGVESCYGIIGAEEKRGEVAAIGKAKDARGVIVFSEEERGVGAVGGVFAEELIDRAQQLIGLVPGNGAETAQVGLQVGHQERGGDAFAGDVGDHKAETVLAEVEKVVVIAADLAGLNADAGVFQSGERRQSLREEAGLDVLGDFEFVGGATLGSLLCGDGATFALPWRGSARRS